MAIYLLPLALLVVALGLGLYARFAGSADHGSGHTAGPADRPLALPPVDAPDAGSPGCARLLAALPATLTASPHPLPRLALRVPAPAGAAAWAGTDAGDPVVLRCGLPRPDELTPASALIVVNGVSWLELSQPDRATFIAVDRPVYVALTVPAGLGSGPVQTISDAVRAALPAQPVRPSR